jgi:hypothetical protein
MPTTNNSITAAIATARKKAFFMVETSSTTRFSRSKHYHRNGTC